MLKNWLARHHPSQWTWTFYLLVAIVLLGLNVFGKRGIVHFVLLKQEQRRLNMQRTDLLAQRDELAAKMKRFNDSDIEKMRSIREELGLLQKDETSLEILSSEPSHSGNH
jgi:hypothetical protein